MIYNLLDILVIFIICVISFLMGCKLTLKAINKHDPFIKANKKRIETLKRTMTTANENQIYDLAFSLFEDFIYKRACGIDIGYLEVNEQTGERIFCRYNNQILKDINLIGTKEGNA